MRRKIFGRLAAAGVSLSCSPERACPVTDERMRYLKRIGTRVKERARLATREMITERESGENRYFAVPCSKNTGTKTIEMQSVARKVGRPTSPAPCRMAYSSGS